MTVRWAGVAESGAGAESRAGGDGYLLGLDAGTGSCRAALFTLDGQPAALAQREWSHPAAGSIPGSQSFDPAGNWALICACIREVLGSVPSPAAVRAIGCSSMGGGLVLYGRGGQELWACANGDTRAEREAAVMLGDGTAAELYWRGGGWISLSAAPRLAWVRHHEPEVWAATARLSMIADWMVFRLTGSLATEASIGSTSGLFDLGLRAWSPELLNRCGLEPAWFPEVVEAGTMVGQLSAGASSQTGLTPGTPVVAGGLDTALGLAGPWPAGSGRLTITGGSFWKQTVVAPGPVVDPAGRLRTICHVWPGQWLVEGISFYAGFALRWLRDHASAGQPAGCGPRYAELEQLAAAVAPGAGGLTAWLVPADAWAWAPWQPPFPPGPGAAQAGLGEQGGLGEQAGLGGQGRLGRQVRAIQETAAYSTRRAAGLISELLGPGAAQEVILTGGAACSRLWPQILADVLGNRVGVPEHTESAARGAAILAGRAAEVLPEDPPPGPRPADAGPVPALDRAVCPSPARQRAYDQLYARWQSAGPGCRGATW